MMELGSVKKRAAALAAVLFSVMLAAPAARSGPAAPDGRQRVYRIVNVDPDAGDNPRRFMNVTEFSYQVSEGEYDGRPAAILVRDEKTKEGDSIHWRMVMDPKSYRLFELEKKVTTRKGNVVEQSREVYNDDLYKYNDHTFHFQALPLIARRMDLTTGAETKVSLVFSPEAAPWEAVFTVEDEEKVTVPAGTFDCVKVRMDSSEENLGFKKGISAYLFKMLLPSYYMWVDKNEPHDMIRYQGKLGGFMSPEQAQELVRVGP